MARLKICSPHIALSRRTIRKRDGLVLEHLEWAHGIARRVASLLPTWFTFEDLCGPVELALFERAASFDPKRGIPFKAYASRRIHGACFDSVRRKEYRERGHLSLSTHRLGLLRDDGGNREMDGVDAQACDPNPSPEAQAASHEQVHVWAQVQQLPPRHALVILAVYGGGMTLETLATKVDVGSSRLSQIHHEALRMLKGMAA
jgi:RNA polymerase sigma factor for flagellar operon FliA